MTEAETARSAKACCMAFMVSWASRVSSRAQPMTRREYASKTSEYEQFFPVAKGTLHLPHSPICTRALVITHRRSQHGQERQSPHASGPGNLREQHQAQPA